VLDFVLHVKVKRLSITVVRRVSLWSKFRGYNLCVYTAYLKMGGAGVSHAFGQSAYTNITDSSYSAGLDATL